MAPCGGMSPRRVLAGVIAAALLCAAAAHETSSDAPPCAAADNPVRVTAPYAPGTITLDGKADDWASIDGQDLLMQQALSSGDPAMYPHGSGAMTLKAAHDGRTLFLLLTAPGPYAYNPVNAHMSISASLMFGIGDDATLWNMGGCPQAADVCSADNCRNHEVDLIHFEVDTAIPGRLYGRNMLDLLDGTGADRIGSLNDGYAFNPHCRFVDEAPGMTVKGLSSNGSAENDWVGVWRHSAVNTAYGLVPSDSPYATAGDAGTFVFEFSRPLRTSDHFQQDAQFSVGAEHRLGAALWYPVDGQPWHGAEHYIISCDWAVLALAPAPVPMYGWSYSAGSQAISTTAATALSSLALLVSLAAVFVSIVVGWWVRANARQFSSMDGL